MDISLSVFILGSIIFLLSAIIQGITGFGFSLLAIPVMSLFILPQELMPISLLFSMIINLYVLFHSKQKGSWVKIKWIFLSAIITIPFGTYLLLILSADQLRFFMGIFIFIIGILFLFGFKKTIKREREMMIPIGLISGLLNGAITMSGPPVILFLVNQNRSKLEFRSHLSLYFLLVNLVTLPVYLYHGLFTSHTVITTAIFLPSLLIGVFLGGWLSHKLPDEIFRKAAIFFMIGIGAYLIISSFFRFVN